MTLDNTSTPNTLTGTNVFPYFNENGEITTASITGLPAVIS